MDNLKFSDEFYSFVRGKQDPVAGALLVSRVIDRDTDLMWIEQEFERLAHGCTEEVCDAKSLCDYLRGQGFGGSENYFRQENSSLNFVLRQKEGIPISLAILLMGVGRILGLLVEGINYPGHFLARVEGVLVDPFSLQVFDASKRLVNSENELIDVGALNVASGRDIVMRMFNNLRQIASDNGDYTNALDYCGYQLILTEEPFPVYVERVSLWLAAGVKEMALHDLEKSISHAPSIEVRSKLERHRATIEASPSKLH